MLKYARRSGTGAMDRLVHMTVIGVAVLGLASTGWAAPTLIEFLQFEGTRFGDPGTEKSFPPDTMGTIGTPSGNTYVELINAGYAQYDTGSQPVNQHTDGVLIGNRMNLDQFWNNAFQNTFDNPGDVQPQLFKSDNAFDPRIVYDANTERWYAVSVDYKESAQSSIYVGVTTSSDPSPANWRGFVLDADMDNQQWADFPTLGYSNEGVFIATEMPAIDGTGASKEVHLTGIPLASLTAPVPSIANARMVEDIGLTNAVQPAIDTSGITASDPKTVYSAFTTKSGERPQMFEIPSDFFSGGALGPLVDILNTGNRSAAQDVDYQASQNLTPIDISVGAEASSNFVLTPFGYWGITNVIGSNDGSKFNNAIQWFNIDDKTGQLIDTGLIENVDRHFLYPSIAVSDFGKIVIGFNWMLDATNVPGGIGAPSVGAVGGVIGPNGVVKFGNPDYTIGADSAATYKNLDAIGRNRWGDYSATNSSSGSHLFWTIQEYAPEKDVWATSLSQLAVVSGNEVFLGPDSTGGYDSITAQAYDGDYTLQKILMDGNLGAVPMGLFDIGDMAIESYMLNFSAELHNGDQIILLEGLEALVEQKFTLTQLEDGFKLFDTQLLSFDLFGLPSGLLLTLDDLRPSLGRLALIETPSGMMVESYIDLYTVLSVDGQSLPSQNASRLLLRTPGVIPEPLTATLGLMGLGALGVATRRRAG